MSQSLDRVGRGSAVCTLFLLALSLVSFVFFLVSVSPPELLLIFVAFFFFLAFAFSLDQYFTVPFLLPALSEYEGEYVPRLYTLHRMYVACMYTLQSVSISCNSPGTYLNSRPVWR